MLCVYLNHAPSLPREQMALSVYITTSRSHRLSVTYLFCFIRTTWLTSDANDFVNAKSHARQKLCSHGTPSLPQWYNRSSPRFLHVLKTGITQQNLSTPPEAKIDYKGYRFHCFHTSGKRKGRATDCASLKVYESLGKSVILVWNGPKRVNRCILRLRKK